MTKEEILTRLNGICANTMMETLDMRFTDVDVEAGMVQMTMPVNSKVHQPLGLLHGGASAALAESIGSAGSVMYLDTSSQAAVGIELSCNHLKGVTSGIITATATVLHKGRSTHLWEIVIRDEEQNLISHCKLTNMIIDKKK